MSTIWDWLIERQRPRQIAEWRKSVDQAEDMVIRVNAAAARSSRAMTLAELIMTFREIVELHRNEPGRTVDFDQAEEVADRVLRELPS